MENGNTIPELETTAFAKVEVIMDQGKLIRSTQSYRTRLTSKFYNSYAFRLKCE